MAIPWWKVDFAVQVDGLYREIATGRKALAMTGGLEMVRGVWGHPLRRKSEICATSPKGRGKGAGMAACGRAGDRKGRPYAGGGRFSGWTV